MGRSRKVSPGDPKVAVAYLRVSTDEQQLGPEAQRAAIEGWAARDGVRIASWHLDQGISGAAEIDQRPALVAALIAVEVHHAGFLVTSKRDRLARDVAICALIERQLRKVGANSISADGIANGVDPMSDLTRSMFDALGAFERAQIIARTRAAMGVKRSRGEFLGQAPYGFRVGPDGKKLIIDAHEQACIVETIRLYTSGLSQEKIAALLWPHYKSRRGKPLGQAQVHRILKGAGMLKSLTASIGELAKKKNGATVATSPGGQRGKATEAPEERVALQVEDASAIASITEHPVTGQRLVNRRTVQRPDYLRHGRPLDLAWVRGQVKTLQGMKIPAERIASALVKTGVRRGDGSDVEAGDVARWTAS